MVNAQSLFSPPISVSIQDGQGRFRARSVCSPSEGVVDYPARLQGKRWVGALSYCVFRNNLVVATCIAPALSIVRTFRGFHAVGDLAAASLHLLR